MRKNFVHIFILVMAVASFGQSASAETQDEADSVRIIRTYPTTSEVLKIGEKIKFSFEVEYSLTSANLGEIVMVLKGDSASKFIVNESRLAEKGTHTETLETEIIIPNTSLIKIYVPLQPQGATSTSSVESVLYKVVK